MSLFKDKYFPKSFENFKIHNKLILGINNLFKDDYIHNTLFYGPYGSGKYTIILNVLLKIFGEDILKKKQSVFNITKSCGNPKEFIIFQSNYHFEINLNKYLFNDRISLVNLLNQLIQTKDVNTSKYKIILIRNIHYLSSDIIKFLGSIIEKYIDNVRFLFTASTNYSRIINILKGRYFLIRIPSPTDDELIDFTSYVFNDNNINMSINNQQKIVSKSDKNLHNLMIYIQLCCENNKYIEYFSPMELYVKEIFKLIKKKNNSSLIKIREYIYNLITKNINIKLFIKQFTKESLNQDLSTEKIIEINKWGTIFENRLSKSYKEVVHFEAFVYKICHILAI